jgi:hypothetical protein
VPRAHQTARAGERGDPRDLRRQVAPGAVIERDMKVEIERAPIDAIVAHGMPAHHKA